MKERCGLGFAGVLLLMLTGGSSDAHNVQRSSEDVHNSYSSSETFDLRESRDAASDLGPLSGLGARGGGAPHVWSERGPGPGGWSANSQGDISKHMVIDVSSADTSVDNQVKPSPARPPNPPVETVLGFETSGEQVPGKVGGPRNDAQVPSGQTSFGSGQQLDNGGKQTGQPGQVGREDISIEVDTDPGSALPSSHGQSAFQTRPDQPRARAVARQSGRLLGDPAKSPRQLSRPMMTRQGAGAGDARPRDSISLTAEVADGPDRGGQAAGAATAPGGPVSSEQLQQRAHSQQWLPEAIPGQAGVDYPTLNVLPQSSFDCGGQEADGFYADTSDEARCQAFWVCHNDQKDGFLCPNGTVFNQRYFACDWWFNVRCQDSPQYYQLNRNIAVLGTPVHGRPDTPPSPETSVHPVLTLLQDILQYPRVPPIPPPSSPAASEENPPIHSAAQPALPSRNQYSDDEFHAPDRASVHVAGGVPGTPPAEGRAGNLMSKGASQETISSTMRLSENKRGIARRHVKRHVKRTPEKQHRAIMKRRRPTRVRARKVRGYDMVHEAEEAERAASALSARIPQMEQSAMSQLKKRTPEPSSGAAFTSVQEGAMPDKPQSLLSGRSGPLLQTVDKVAFPMDAKGPDFPKVEEDFNIQETSGIRKSTSIKSVLPSHLDIPQPGAVNVMAASGSQQNADVNSQSGVGNQASITDLSDDDTGVSKNFAGISLTEDVQLDKDAHAQVPGVISDAETVSGSYGPGHGVSLVEDVEFDKKESVPAPASPAAPQSKPGPNGMSVLESVAGDNGHGPGVSVQENVQVDQKRDVSAAVGPPDASSPGMPAPQQTPGNPAAGPAAGGGPGMTMTEDVAVSRPTSNENTVAGVGDPMSGDNMRSPGVSLTENVQIGHKGNSPPNGPSSNAQPVSGNPAGGQAMTGGAGSVGGAEPANGGRPPNVDQMAVDGFLSDQTAVRNSAAGATPWTRHTK
ncbi:hypothetical protein FJT64_003680 [Amphibalanus amphitrite]|uniref:Chitin-binding type-2 domain-containing protein n=1 Tax=Amphibalanus amphitrite TaxID=1232801 RepID=A0A6A4WA34_AMPAM|nr:hypothetical protein FJT64_003680 [Amphibalanus amphitrite]